MSGQQTILQHPSTMDKIERWVTFYCVSADLIFYLIACVFFVEKRKHAKPNFVGKKYMKKVVMLNDVIKNALQTKK